MNIYFWRIMLKPNIMLYIINNIVICFKFKTNILQKFFL